MKMGYLAAGSPDCPLVRLYDFTQEDVVQLCRLFASLASVAVESAALHEQPFIQPLDGLRVTLRVAKRDQGLVQTDAKSFDCLLTQEGWEDQRDWALPFGGESCGDFTWLLFDVPGGARLLLSRDGRW